MQADHTGGRFGHYTAQPAALGHHSLRAVHQRVEVVDRLLQLARSRPSHRAQRASGIAQHHGSSARQFSGDSLHRDLHLIALLGTAQRQLGRDRAGTTPAEPRRSRARVRGAPPEPVIRATVRAIDPTAFANRPESVGSPTSASTTVVSARTLSVRSSLAAAALASSASLSPATASSPHRRVIFINVGCGTRMPSGIRQNRFQENRIGHLPAQHLIAQPVAELQEHQPQVGLHRDRRATDAGIEIRCKRREEHRIIQQRIHASQLSGNTNNSDGKIASHNVGWSLTVLSTMASIPPSQGFEAILSAQPIQSTIHAPTFQALVDTGVYMRITQWYIAFGCT